MTNTDETKERIKEKQDNILKLFNELAGFPSDTKYNKDRKATLVSAKTIYKMERVAYDYKILIEAANENKSNVHFYSDWAYDIMKQYFYVEI